METIDLTLIILESFFVIDLETFDVPAYSILSAPMTAFFLWQNLAELSSFSEIFYTAKFLKYKSLSGIFKFFEPSSDAIGKTPSLGGGEYCKNIYIPLFSKVFYCQ